MSLLFLTIFLITAVFVINTFFEITAVFVIPNYFYATCPQFLSSKSLKQNKCVSNVLIFDWIVCIYVYKPVKQSMDKKVTSRLQKWNELPSIYLVKLDMFENILFWKHLPLYYLFTNCMTILYAIRYVKLQIICQILNWTYVFFCTSIRTVYSTSSDKITPVLFYLLQQALLRGYIPETIHPLWDWKGPR